MFENNLNIEYILQDGFLYEVLFLFFILNQYLF